MPGFGTRRFARRQATRAAPPAAPVILAILAGQSNMEGQGTDAMETDVPGVVQFAGSSADTATYRTLTADITPEYAPGTIQATRVNPGNYIARQLLLDNPTATVVLVPTFKGSTSLVNGNAEWLSSATPGAGGFLFENMVTQANLAYAAAQSAYPGRPINVQSYWVQGEFDATGGITRTAYLAALTDLITRARARITGAATAPLVIGSMLPQLWLLGSANYGAGYAAINAAHVDASRTVAGVRYAIGPDIRGGNDNLHYQPAAVVRALGTAMGAALSDTVGPTVTSGAAFTRTQGQPLAIALTGDDRHQTVEIAGGTDAGQFEISDPYLSPNLRWTGDSVGPAVGTYTVGVRARDGAGNHGPTLTITVTLAAAGAVSPATFFASGERGAVWDLTDAATLFQDREGTTPVTAAGQPVGRVNDKSPNANHWQARANDTTRPTYQVDGDGKPYLAFDGTNDLLVAATPLVLATDPRFTCIMAGLAASTGVARVLIGSHSSTGSGSNPRVEPFAQNSTTAVTMAVTTTSGTNASTMPTLAAVFDGTKRVLTSAFAATSTTGNFARLRDAGARGTGAATSGYSAATIASSVVGTTYAADRASLGARYNGATPDRFWAGRIYSGFAINRVLTDAEVKAGEDWAAARAAVTLP